MPHLVSEVPRIGLYFRWLVGLQILFRFAIQLGLAYRLSGLFDVPQTIHFDPAVIGVCDYEFARGVGTTFIVFSGI